MKIAVSGLVLAVVLATTANAQETASAPTAAPAATSAAPVSAPAATSQKIAKFSKIILNPEITKENQKIKVGTICLLSGSPVNFGDAQRTLNFERFERLFSDHLKAKGFKVQATSNDLFEGDGDPNQANFLFGATLQPTNVRMCDSVNGYKGEISISVEWQIFDRAQKKVVEVVKTSGVGTRAKFDIDGFEGMINDGFKASLDALVEQGLVAKYLGAPAPA